MKRIILSIACLISLNACGATADSKTLLGVDSNNDGVRDDIEVYIKQKYPQQDQQNAVMQMARYYQSVMSLDSDSYKDVQTISREGDRSFTCVFKTFKGGSDANGKSIADEIVKLTMNTRKRRKAYKRYDHALDGSVFTIPRENYCDN